MRKLVPLDDLLINVYKRSDSIVNDDDLYQVNRFTHCDEDGNIFDICFIIKNIHQMTNLLFFRHPTENVINKRDIKFSILGNYFPPINNILLIQVINIYEQNCTSEFIRPKKGSYIRIIIYIYYCIRAE